MPYWCNRSRRINKKYNEFIILNPNLIKDNIHNIGQKLDLLIKADDEYINVESFRYITSVSFSTYDYVSGKVFLTHDENIVTLDFKDYTFKNDKGSTFVVNGSAKYID